MTHSKKTLPADIENYDSGYVSRALLEQALDYLVSIEPNPEHVQSTKHYNAMMAPYKEQISKAETIVYNYGQQIKPNNLEHMQAAYYSITNSDKYRRTFTGLSVVCTTLNSVWDGIGDWRY